jgi:glycosyltransferase involved in cell wall biosynthesis
MKAKIYYLTRSYSPYQKGGGALMRAGAVKHLKELGWDVTVIMPSYNSKEVIIEDSVIQIPFENNHIQKLASLFERIGIYEDYLDKWVKNAFKYLKNKIEQKDLVFATSGGELGMIKLGSLLKYELNCKFVVNFRDPLDYSLVHGRKLNNKFHINREKKEKKYLENSNLIIASSISNQKSLKNKYPQWRNKIKNNYFGYINDINLRINNISKDHILRIAYVGNMSSTQKPEVLYETFNQLVSDNVEIYFIGNSENYKPIENINNKKVRLINFLPHGEFLKFMSENIDVAFVSLASDYLGACVPSKIYEYINLGLPMIGALPDGDAKDIINSNGYGIACNYNDIQCLCDSIGIMSNKLLLEETKNNILNNRKMWSMGEKIQEVNALLKEIVNEN